MKRLAVPAILTCLVLAACTTGDLGRPRPSLFNDQIVPAMGEWAARLRGEAASHFHLTDDEQQLRARAWRLVMPAHERSAFETQLASLVPARMLPTAVQSGSVSDYQRALTAGSFASQASRYNRLAEDANADRALLAPFRANAIRVVNADRARLRTLEASPRVPAESQEPAQARVIENEALVLWVCERLRFRLASYRYALDNLVVEMPSREAVRAERAIMGLEAETDLVCKLPLIGVFGGEGAAPSDRPVVYKG